MRARVLLVITGLAAGIVGACSSGGAVAPVTHADAGPGEGAGLGEQCDPSAPIPCVVLTDACSVAVCDSTTHLCVRVSVDAGPTCGGSPPPSCAEGECDAAVVDGEAGGADVVSDGGEEGGEGGEPPGDAGRDATSDAGDHGDAGDAGGD